MSKNCDQTNSSNEESARARNWPRVSGTRRRDRERAEYDADRIRDVRYLWAKGAHAPPSVG